MATKPHHFQSAPLSRYVIENRLEDRELALATRKVQLDKIEEDLLEHETAFRKYSGSRPQDVERLRELEAEVEHLAFLNEQLKNRETKMVIYRKSSRRPST
ncbi:unnamed protein product [Brachionus calyciflorus]|uniref:Uncharacterized protein n=1 Tax=Brachionus calyciflorus TaxID=104777 RepID=A0A814RNQ7_9BILA|nr:unnamed protein product [Brachionus calyciflorus]